MYVRVPWAHDCCASTTIKETVWVGLINFRLRAYALYPASIRVHEASAELLCALRLPPAFPQTAHNNPRLVVSSILTPTWHIDNILHCLSRVPQRNYHVLRYIDSSSAYIWSRRHSLPREGGGATQVVCCSGAPAVAAKSETGRPSAGRSEWILWCIRLFCRGTKIIQIFEVACSPRSDRGFWGPS